MGHAMKAKIMVLVPKPKPKKTPRKEKKMISAIAMAGQPIVEDEERYKATHTISRAGCDKGSNN